MNYVIKLTKRIHYVMKFNKCLMVLFLKIVQLKLMPLKLKPISLLLILIEKLGFLETEF